MISLRAHPLRFLLSRPASLGGRTRGAIVSTQRKGVNPCDETWRSDRLLQTRRVLAFRGLPRSFDPRYNRHSRTFALAALSKQKIQSGGFLGAARGATGQYFILAVFVKAPPRNSPVGHRLQCRTPRADAKHHGIEPGSGAGAL